MADMQRFVGYDTNNNPITEDYHFHGDARYTARSEEAADISNWNMMLYQNAYNDPSAQVDRLRKAGLNPNFFLANNAGTTPAASGGNASGHSMTSANGKLGQVLDASRNAADTLLATQKQAWEYDIAQRELAIKDREVGIQEKMLPYNQKKTDTEASKNVQDVEESKSRQAVMQEEINNLKKDGVIKENQAKAIEANIAYTEQQTKLAHEQIGTEKTKQALNRAQAALSNTQSSYYKEITQPTVDKIMSELDVNKQEALKIFQEIGNLMAQEDQTKANTELIAKQAELAKRYGDAEKIVGLFNGIMQGWNSFFSGVHHATGAVNDVLENTPVGAVKNVTKAGGRAYNNSNTNRIN